jgi:hypothetical protein
MRRLFNKKFSPLIVITGLFAVFTAALNIKPGLLDRRTFDIIDFLIHNFILSAFTVSMAILLSILILAMPGASRAIEIVNQTYKKHDLQPIFQKRVSFFLSLFITIVLIGWVIFETFSLSRNIYSYLRDDVAKQYRREIYASASIVHAVGDLEKALDMYKNINERFNGTKMGEQALDRMNLISKQLYLKKIMIQHADSYRKSYGINRQTLFLMAEALRLDPWDEDLRIHIENDLKKYKIMQANLLAVIPSCANCNQIDTQTMQRALVTLGYNRDLDFLPSGFSTKSLTSELCDAISKWTNQEIISHTDRVWMIPQLDEIIKQSSSGLLLQRKKTLEHKLSDKWERLASFLSDDEEYEESNLDDGPKFRH